VFPLPSGRKKENKATEKTFLCLLRKKCRQISNNNEFEVDYHGNLVTLQQQVVGNSGLFYALYSKIHRPNCQ
jgi:hypothetical protein